MFDNIGVCLSLLCSQAEGRRNAKAGRRGWASREDEVWHRAPWRGIATTPRRIAAGPVGNRVIVNTPLPLVNAQFGRGHVALLRGQ